MGKSGEYVLVVGTAFELTIGFNFLKCKCLHAVHGNTELKYDIAGTIVCETLKNNFLGVTINGMIRRNITY